jgi:HK97 family phage portal protein
LGFFTRLWRGLSRRANDWWLKFSDVSFGSATHAGTTVTQATAPCLPAVYRCWSLNAETISSLPIDAYAKRGDKRVPYQMPYWLEQPNDWQDWGQFILQADLSYESDGNIYILKAVTGAGQVAGLYVLAPAAVEPVMRDGYKMYDVTLDDGRVKPYAANEIVHITGLVPPGQLKGLSPIGVALKETIGIGLAAEQFGAQYFGTGATMSGIITLPATAGKFGDAEAERMAASMQRKHGGVNKSHAIGVLTGGATWTPISVNPEESQFLETRQYTDTQIAQVYGCPSEYVTNIEGAKGFVSGLYARQYMWLQTGINPRLVRIERALSSLLPKDVYVKFNRNAFLQMDPTDRANFYAAGLRDRWLTPNEVRSFEDLDPLADGDEPLMSVQWQDAQPTVQ